MIKYTNFSLPWSRSREPGAGAETTVYRLQLRLRPKVSAPAGSGSATLHDILTLKKGLYGSDDKEYIFTPYRHRKQAMAY
jgi:hypothetical protein